MWINIEENKIYHLVSWDNAFLPKCYGGLGITKIGHLNNALLGKKIWHIFYIYGEWRDIMIENHLRRMSLIFIFSEARIPHGSYI